MPANSAVLRRAALPVALAAAAFLGACASKVPLSDNKAQVEVAQPVPADSSANTAATSQSQVTSVDVSHEDPNASAPRIVYFDFDSFAVRDDSRPVVESQAKRLVANKNLHITVEGHTDERGSSEYNLALGQKRSEAVLKSLETLGAGANQLEAVSFGKERPAVEGHDEDAWAKNRRAELKDR